MANIQPTGFKRVRSLEEWEKEYNVQYKAPAVRKSAAGSASSHGGTDKTLTSGSSLLTGASAFVNAARDKKTGNDLAARTQELEALRKQRAQVALSSQGVGVGNSTGMGAGMGTANAANQKQLAELDALIKQKNEELEVLEKEFYGYGDNKLKNAARRVGRTVSGTAKSVAGNVEETLGQLTNTHLEGKTGTGGNLGGWGSYAEMTAPTKTREQREKEQRALKESRFQKSDELAESATEDLETAKAGLSVLGKTAVDLSSEGLKMAGDLAANALAPGAGTVGLMTRAFGSGAQEARHAGATAEQQVLYGATVGGIEALTERMFAAALPLRKAYGAAAKFGGKSLDDLLDAGIRKLTSNATVQKLASSFIGESLEEIISDIANPYAKLIYDGGDALKTKFTTTEGFTDALAEELYDGLIGGLLGGFGGGVELVTTGASNAAIGQRVIDSQSNFGLVELGLNYAEGSKSRKIAEEIAAKLNAADDLTRPGVKVSDYGRLARAMQTEAEARPTLNSKPSAQMITETGDTVTQMSPVAEAFRAKGDNAATSVRKAQVLERMMDGEPVSNKQLESLGLRETSTQAVLTELTGVEVPQGATNSELRKIFRAAVETAAEARQATQNLGQIVAEAQDAIAEAQDANDARAEETAAQIMTDAEQAVAAENEAGSGILFEGGETLTREELRDSLQKYFSARGEQSTTEQADALYDRLKQYNETNGPVTGTLMGETAAGEDAASDLNGFAPEAAQAFAVDTEAATGETDAAANKTGGAVSQEQQWTARYVKSALKDLGVKDVVYDGANLGSARAMVSDGVIYLNENRLDAQRAIMWAVGHELVHPGAKADTQLADTIIGAFQTTAESGALSEVVQYQVENIDDLIAEKTAAYKRYLVEERGKTPEQADATVTEAYIREEIAADWMGYVFENQNALERLAEIEPGLLTKALRAVRKIRSGGETELLSGGKTAEGAEKRLAGLEQRLKSALLWADDTSHAPVRPNPESVDTAGKNEYNEIAETFSVSGLSYAERRTLEGNRIERLRQFYDDLPPIWYAYTANAFYIYENSSFMDYTVLEKIPLAGGENLIRRAITEVRNGEYRNYRSAREWAGALRRESGHNGGDPFDAAGGTAAVESDVLDGRSRGRDGVANLRAGGQAEEYSHYSNDSARGEENYSIDSTDYRGREDAGRTGEGRQALGAYYPGHEGGRRDGSGNLAVRKGELTPEIRAKATERGVPDLGLSETTDFAAYSQALDAARTANRNGAMVDPQSVDGLTESGARTFLNGDGTAGVAVENDGNIVGVFKHPRNPTSRSAADLLLNALANGGNHLDCYVLQPEVSGSNLGRIYSQLGFEPVAYLRFNREYAAPDWDYASFGEPDVVMWVHSGDSVETVAERIGDYHYYSPVEIRETCKEFTDYGEAKAYQLKQLNMRQTAQASEDAGAVSDSEDLRYSVGDFSEQVDLALAGKWGRYNALYVGKTSSLMEKLGMKPLPVLMTTAHLQNIVAEKDARKPRQHGLSVDQVKSLGGILSDPVMVLDSISRDDAVVFVSDQVDPDGLPIVAVIRPNGTGVYEMTRQSANFLLSMYGREGFNDFIDKAAQRDKILYINKEKSQTLFGDAGVQFATGLNNADSNGILHQSRNIVKSESEGRFSIEGQKKFESLLDSEDFQAFLKDFYSGYGGTAIDNTVTASGGQRVSRVRSNTLAQTRREQAARVLGEERGKAIDRIFTLDEKRMERLDADNFTYDVETEKQSMARAKERLTNDYAGTKTALEHSMWHSGEDLDAAMGVLAAELADARKSGDYDTAIEWAHLIQEQGTGAGQFIHAFAKYTRSPEGVLVRAAETLDAAGVKPALRDDLLNQIAQFTETLGVIQKGDQKSKDSLIDLIVKQAKQRNTKVSRTTLKNLNFQKVEFLYDAALNQLDQIAQDYVKTSAGKKIGTYQTMSHLLNFRTANRNVVSNQIFDLVDSLANNMSLLPDAVMGAFTGRRTIGFEKSWASSGKRHGAAEGLRRAWVEAALDINPDAANSRDKYGTARRTWKMTGNKGAQAMSTLEKAMGFELNVTDEFHKGSVAGEVTESLARAVERGDITQAEAEAWAQQEALYRSFQDDTFVGGLLGNLKSILNTVGFGRTGKKMGRLEIKEFGLGDFVQKYTQVPGALITRAIEFSPVGYAKAIYCLAKFSSANRASTQAETVAVSAQTAADANPERTRLARRAFRAKETAAQARMDANKAQRMAALALGRATTGTGLIAAFAALAAQGLLKRADDEDDADAKALKAAEGISGTQLNTSALARWIQGESTEWRDGDELISIEFLEPLNALMTMGAMVAKDNTDASFWEKVRNYGGDSMEALYQSMLEIPTMQTLQTIQAAQQYHTDDSVLPLWAEIPFEIARGSLTGFVPSLLRQGAQASDTIYRETYGDRNPFTQAKSSVQNSVPVLRNDLDPKLDNFGRPKQLEDAARNIMNAFVNPGSARTYRQSTVSRELDTVYGEIGEANIYPDRSAPYTMSFTKDKETVKFSLTAAERQQYQKTRGQMTYTLMQQSMADPLYKYAGADEKSELLTEIKNYANYIAQKEFLSKKGESYSNAKYEKYGEALDVGLTLSAYLAVRSACSELESDKDANGKTIKNSLARKQASMIDSYDLTPEQKEFLFRCETTSKLSVNWS